MIQSAPEITVSERVPLSAAGHTKASGRSGFETLLKAVGNSMAASSQLADDVTAVAPEVLLGETPSARGRVGSEREAGTPPPIDSSPLSPNEQLGFFRSDDLEGPVRFKQVPEWAKWPEGNFRQAPEESGGDWWKITPFTSSQPWTSLSRPFEHPLEILPEGFEGLFGTRPQYADYDGYLDFKVAELRWEGSLERFKGIGLPEGIDPEALAASTQVMLDWGLGEPQFYEDSYGWHAKFPDSLNPRFQINPTTLLMAPQLTVSSYQVGLIQLGIAPDRLHPFVPPFLLDQLKDPVVA